MGTPFPRTQHPSHTERQEKTATLRFTLRHIAWKARHLSCTVEGTSRLGTDSAEVNGIMQAAGQPDLIIKITPSEQGNPSGKLADVELHFGGGSLLAGLKLVGFSIWEGRAGRGRNVLFPARQYAMNSERRCFALLRPVVDRNAPDSIRDRILEAYAEYEQRATADDAQRSPTK